MSTNLRLLMIGSGGLVGSAITDYCLRKEVCVTAVDRAKCDWLDSISVDSLLTQLEPASYSVIFSSVIPRDSDDSIQPMQENLIMVSNFLQFAKRLKPRHVVFLSSACVYGNQPRLPITEENVLQPDNYYGIGRVAAELMVQKELRDICPHCIFRLPGVYGGPVDELRGTSMRASFILRMINAIKNGDQISLSAEGKIRRDYIYADDVSAIVLQASKRGASGLLNLATGLSLSILELVKLLSDHIGISPKIEIRKDASSRDFDLIFDIERLTKMYFRPRNFHEALLDKVL